MIKKTLSLSLILFISFAFTSNTYSSKTVEAGLASEVAVAEPIAPAFEYEMLYEEFSSSNVSLPAVTVFEKAMTGYSRLEKKGLVKNKLLTVVDFGLSSSKKRMWILNMDTKKVLFHTFVSHGKNTGGEFATQFSNTVNSLQSSLGFYVTAETYYGKNGLSLFIDGQEKGFNSNARKRYVVIHGADYAESSFIDSMGRLGRSYGCPAVPNSIAKNLIQTIEGNSVVYIHKENEKYLNNSALLN